jgi:hypothetical protein
MLGLDGAHRRRFDLLLPLYRLKWVCIRLNDFLAADAARRSFSESRTRAERCARQLGAAEAALADFAA